VPSNAEIVRVEDLRACRAKVRIPSSNADIVARDDSIVGRLWNSIARAFQVQSANQILVIYLRHGCSRNPFKRYAE
jgi:hypothetical protein